ncbi:hypothetical protein [Rhizobium mongolense]|nr:hypothetical protein [Rhizobium mongolense]
MMFSLWLVFATQYREGYAQSGASGNRAEETICRLDGRCFFFVLFSFQVRFGALLISATKQCAWEGQA